MVPIGLDGLFELVMALLCGRKRERHDVGFRDAGGLERQSKLHDVVDRKEVFRALGCPCDGPAAVLLIKSCCGPERDRLRLGRGGFRDDRGDADDDGLRGEVEAAAISLVNSASMGDAELNRSVAAGLGDRIRADAHVPGAEDHQGE
eukprot:CAMPEP_0117663712 /NCGR_PEP_ID=MMETSP0804-20121206/8772_1 /TAXON_ID=1074897 /ORGANISM="Tetraselmis astigmatica, Strain CCMP880" /LENGTH=146 /DNA_ID=CAMNT_0005470775 /DNA_START=388 /DNA_END=828 /DNA_ORIENTATION=-